MSNRAAQALLGALVILAAGCGPRAGGAKEPGDKHESQPEAGTDVGGAAPEVGGAQDQGPDVIDLASQASIGKVVLDHRTHRKDFACTSCHHTFKPGEVIRTCHSCHVQEGASMAAQDAFHQACQGCHAEQGGPASKCNGCHLK